MYAVDFEYDGQNLSDYGFIICNFDSPGMATVSAGSTITFNKVSRHYGKRFGLTSTQYDECIQSTFCIAKNPHEFDKDDLKITNDEYRDLIRWLNRRDFFKFRLVENDEYDVDTCYYNASFNISKIKIGENLYGLELTLETDKPFGYGQEQVYFWKSSGNKRNEYIIYDVSDEIGYTYPSMKITCRSDGNLTLHNNLEECTMVIRNCKNGEVITIDGDTQIISTSYDSHRICDDFNFEFLRIGNTVTERNNVLTCDLWCDIEIKYTPIIKDSV